MTKPFFIGIDGPTAAGKTTVAKHLSKILRMTYIDTGAFYRALAYWFYKKSIDGYEFYNPITQEPNEQLINKILLDPNTAPKLDVQHDSAGNQMMIINYIPISDNDLRTEQISQAASRISTLNSVRDFLLNKQREISLNKPSIMEGRDICTVVMPDSNLKIFLTADVNIRINRRYRQLYNNAVNNHKKIPNLQQVSSDLKQRDKRDLNRKIAPLMKCEDSIIIHNNTSLNDVINTILKSINTDVLKFIHTFSDLLGKNVSIFRQGYCYHYAQMIKANFERGEICWAAPFGHIVWKDDNGLIYDSEGLYLGEADYIIPIKYIEKHLEDFRHNITPKYKGATQEFIDETISRYKKDMNLL